MATVYDAMSRLVLTIENGQGGQPQKMEIAVKALTVQPMGDKDCGIVVNAHVNGMPGPLRPFYEPDTRATYHNTRVTLRLPSANDVEVHQFMADLMQFSREVSSVNVNMVELTLPRERLKKIIDKMTPRLDANDGFKKVCDDEPWFSLGVWADYADDHQMYDFATGMRRIIKYKRYPLYVAAQPGHKGGYFWGRSSDMRGASHFVPELVFNHSLLDEDLTSAKAFHSTNAAFTSLAQAWGIFITEIPS